MMMNANKTRQKPVSEHLQVASFPAQRESALQLRSMSQQRDIVHRSPATMTTSPQYCNRASRATDENTTNLTYLFHNDRIITRSVRNK